MIPKTGFKPVVKPNIAADIASDYFGSGATPMNFKSHLQIDPLHRLTEPSAAVHGREWAQAPFQAEAQDRGSAQSACGPNLLTFPVPYQCNPLNQKLLNLCFGLACALEWLATNGLTLDVGSAVKQCLNPLPE
jgi:hypothetical protein